jgi:hypothetical protein
MGSSFKASSESAPSSFGLREPTKFGNGKPYTGEIGTSASLADAGTKAFAEKYKMLTNDDVFRIAGLRQPKGVTVTALGNPVVTNMDFSGSVKQVFEFKEKGKNPYYIGARILLDKEPISSEAKLESLIRIPYDNTSNRNPGNTGFRLEKDAVLYKYSGKPYGVK